MLGFAMPRLARQRGLVLRAAGLVLILSALGAMAACGGATPQTYSINVTTTAGSSTQVVTYTLTVQ